MWQRGALPWRLQSAHVRHVGGHTMLLPPSSLQLCLCTGLACSVHRQTQPSARLPGRENRKLEPDWK